MSKISKFVRWLKDNEIFHKYKINWMYHPNQYQHTTPFEQLEMFNFNSEYLSSKLKGWSWSESEEGWEWWSEKRHELKKKKH